MHPNLHQEYGLVSRVSENIIYWKTSQGLVTKPKNNITASRIPQNQNMLQNMHHNQTKQ